MREVAYEKTLDGIEKFKNTIKFWTRGERGRPHHLVSSRLSLPRQSRLD
jgi:hypothetical protein